MLKGILGVSYLVCLFGGMIFTLLALYYLFVMLFNAKLERRRLLPFLGPLLLFLPQLWNDRGNGARIKVIVYIVLFAACFGSARFIITTSLQ